MAKSIGRAVGGLLGALIVIEVTKPLIKEIRKIDLKDKVKRKKKKSY